MVAQASLFLAAEETLRFDLGNLLFVLVAAWLAGRAVTRLGYPAILGELLAGIVLGPALLGVLHPGEGLDVIGHLGIILMMLYIGMEIDAADLRRASVPGLLAAVGGFVTPFALGYLTVILFGGTHLAALFVAISVGVTSLATKSRILVDLRLFDTRIAYVLMAGALLSDTATLVIFAAIIGFVEVGGFDVAGTARVAGEAAAFFAVTGFLGLVVFPVLGRRLRDAGLTDRTVGLALVIGVGLLFAQFAEVAGLHAILGSFVAGLFLRGEVMGRRLFHEVSDLLRDLSIGLLAPVFFVTAGFHITFDVFRTDLGLLLAILAVAMFGKIGGTALFYVPSGHGWREGVTVGAAMNGRGAVEIIVAGIGLELGLISVEIFTILVFMAIVTTATVPVLLTLGVEWLRRRGELAPSGQERRGVVVVGAGPTARALAGALRDARPVTLIDANAARCATARREGLSAVQGDALEPETLERAGIEDAGTLIALTPNSEVNVLAAQLAREEYLIPQVRVAVGVRLSRALESIAETAGAHSLFDAQIDIGLWDRWIETGDARPAAYVVRSEEQARALDDQLRSGRTQFPLAVVRGDDRLAFAVVDRLEVEDEVMVMTRDGEHTEGSTVPAAASRVG